MKRIFAAMIVLSMSISFAFSQETFVDASRKGSEISPYIYGQFIEHLGRCIYGGIWAEMLEDRKFFQPVGSKESPWRGWKSIKEDDGGRLEAMQPDMDGNEPFTGEHSPKLVLDGNLNYVSLGQRGLAFEKGRKYVGYVWIKCSGKIDKLLLGAAPLVSDDGLFHVMGDLKLQEIPFKTDGYYKYSFEFEWPNDPNDIRDPAKRRDATFFLTAQGGAGTVHVGTMSLMPADNIHGMRADTLKLLKELNSPVYRWPGGNFVSGYDWNDGIGDRDRRPPRKNPAWKGIEHNDFGLDEFMVFCRYLNAEPYIAVNTGSGEVDGALAELEYANGSADSPQGKRRAANGNREPYKVKFWGIGNEMYGNWQIGHMPTEKYAEKHNKFADAFRKADPEAVLVAVGHVGKWDEIIMRHCADHMDLISEHFYVGEKKDATVEQHVENVPKAIRNILTAHRKYRSEILELRDKNIRIAMDEWNYWYGPHVFGELGTRYSVRDGLGIAAGLHEFFRNSDLVYMANYAQTVNVIGCIKTSKTGARFETTGLVLRLYRNHFGTIPLAVESPRPLDVAAALTGDGKTLTVGIVNPTDEKSTLKLSLKGIKTADRGKRFEIVGKDPMDYNDPDQPQKIDIVESDTGIDFAEGISVPPYSVTLLKVPVSDL